MVLDRDSVQLTANPSAVLPPSGDRDSIFGDTYDGVPNPQIPFQHAYPTRYHGPVWTMAQPGYAYAPRPYASAPFLGLGELRSPLTGTPLADAALGALVGWLGAPTRSQALGYAAAGMIVAGFLGSVGILGLLGFELYQAHQQGRLRPELSSGS
jgi:hypothetical protein